MVNAPLNQRRVISILHVDIVNSTSFVEKRDPERIREILQAYFRRCDALVERYRGMIAHHTGDGFQAFFGYPAASEDSAFMALSAALALREMVDSFSSVDRFTCRLGVATGNVIVDAPSDAEGKKGLMAFGTTAHMAARLEGSGLPGQILVDDSTMRLCSSRFSFQSFGTLSLKGFSQSFTVWEVKHQLPPASRFVPLHLSPYVGRIEELNLLKSRLKAAGDGQGQVVTIVGEPGMGKSRLVYEFVRDLPKSTVVSLKFQCDSQYSSTPLHPWIHSIERLAGIGYADDLSARATKLQAYLRKALLFDDQLTEYVCNLMGASQSSVGDHPPRQLLAELQRRLINIILQAARDHALVLIVEDIQWIDESTLEIVQKLIGLIETEKVFVLLTSRPTVNPLRSVSITLLSLTRLDPESTRYLISKLSNRGSGISDATLERIQRASSGNPLFIEQLTEHCVVTNDLRESQPEADGALPIPNPLQGILMGRFDASGDCKLVAQLASVLGDRFSENILAEIIGAELDYVKRRIETLVEMRIFRRVCREGLYSYEFCHALVRDAVYSSLLKSDSQHMHQTIAEHLAMHWDGIVPDEIVAHHYERAHDTVNALRKWLSAGRRALRTGATSEASALLRRALSLAEQSPNEGPILADLQLIYLSYGVALNASQGIAANPIAYMVRAEEISTRLGNDNETFEALTWQFGLHFNAGEIVQSIRPSEKMKVLAVKVNDQIAMASACQGMGMAEFMLGNFQKARAEFDHGLTVAAGMKSDVHCFPSMTLSYLAWTLLLLGFDKMATDCAENAVLSARTESSHALATALSNCCYVFQCMGRIDKIYELNSELVEHTRKYGEHIYLRRAIIMRNWADAISGNDMGALDEMSSHIRFLVQSKEEIETTFLYSLLAQAQLKFGNCDDAKRNLHIAMAISEKNHERFYLPEIYRLMFEAETMKSSDAGREAGLHYLQRAKEMALSQGARWWLAKEYME
jgi:class 3 adenylate cyclase